MKMSMHINEIISVTITHVKENRKTGGKKGEKELCVDTMIMEKTNGAIKNGQSRDTGNS